MIARSLLTAGLGVLLATRSARAQVCERGRLGPRLPLGVTLDDADLGVTPSPCGETALSVEGRATALLALDDFYGALDGALVASGALRLGSRAWLSGALTALQYRFVQNVSVVGTRLGVGASTLGFHGLLVDRPRWRLSAYGRVRLPTETGAQYAWRTGVEPGAAALWAPHARVTVALGLSVPVNLAVLGSRVTTRATARVAGDVAWRFGWFEPAAGVELRVGGDDAGALEYLALKAGLRFHTGARWVLSLDVIAPLAGVERTNARAALAATHAF